MKTENKYFKYDKDLRDQQTVLKQSNIIKYFCDRNIQAFQPYIKQEASKLTLNKLQETLKSKISIERIDFGDGRYVEYRDNSSLNQTFEMPNKTIILIAGVPGSITYFGRLEKGLGQSFCRIINFYVPGFDRQDERRGTYQGSLDDLVQLIDDFMIKLSIQKAVFILHSFGGIIVKSFALFQPQKVEAMIQIASVPITKYDGLNFYEGIERNLFSQEVYSLKFDDLQDQKYRENLVQTVLKKKKEFSVLPEEQQMKLYGPIFMISPYDVINLLKLRLSRSGGIYEILHEMRQVSKLIPRMIVYSLNDNVIPPTIVEEEIYEFVIGETAVKRKIIQQTGNEPQLDTNDFGSNYIFNLPNTTHNIQHEKGIEIGFLSKHFIRQLDSTKIIHKHPHL